MPQTAMSPTSRGPLPEGGAEAGGSMDNEDLSEGDRSLAEDLRQRLDACYAWEASAKAVLPTDAAGQGPGTSLALQQLQVISQCWNIHAGWTMGQAVYMHWARGLLADTQASPQWPTLRAVQGSDALLKGKQMSYTAPPTDGLGRSSICGPVELIELMELSCLTTWLTFC